MENTYLVSIPAMQKKDHLHIRGEYDETHCVSRLPKGSSPHTWRILIQNVKLVYWYRIISTYVENTVKLEGITVDGEDHLHIRGEYQLFF